MRGEESTHWATLVIVCGIALWGAFFWHFLREIRELPVFWPPFLTLLLGTGFSVAIAYMGYWLRRAEHVEAAFRRYMVGWGIGGAVLLSSIHAIALVLQIAEGRTIGEPVLDLLLGVGSGLTVGLLVGFSYHRARANEERARDRSDALAFLHSTLRHELLNGLNIVQGNADRIASITENQDDSPETEITHRIETIRDRASHMSEVVHHSRIFATTFLGDETLESIDLTQSLIDRVTATRNTYPDATVSAEIPADVSVLANEALSHVFENILQNAVRHNDKPVPEVNVSVEETSDMVAVEVADNGPGVPDREKSSIFERDLTREHGFGLYLTKKLVEYYGGSISVKDNQPDGSIFRVELQPAG